MQNSDRLATDDPAVVSTFEHLRKELQEKFKGMLLAGSRAYGVPRTHSDYDLQIIADVPLPERRLGRASGHWIDLSIKSVEQVRGDFDKPGIAEMFARGKIVFDPYGILVNVRAEAQLALDTPVPSPPMSSRPFTRVSLQQLLYDAVDMLDKGELAAANYAMTALLHALITQLAAHEGRWAGKVSQHLTFLKENGPAVFELAIIAAAPSDQKGRTQALQILLNSVFSATPLPTLSADDNWVARPA